MLKLSLKVFALSIVLFSLPLLAQNSGTDTASIQGLPSSSLQPRILRAIDESKLVTLRGNTHPMAQSKFDQGPAPVSMQANRLLLVLARSTEQEAALHTYLESVQDANSPNYQKFMSPEEFGNSFGVGNADLQTIQSWLTGHGFTVNKVEKGRMAIEFSGTVGQVQQAFHTSIHSYLVNGEQQWANATDPQIPSALAPVVAGLSSLNSFKPKAQYIRGPSAAVDTQKHTITPTYTNGNTTDGYYIFLGPADAATIYDTPTSLNPNLSGTAYTGSGVTIGIVGDSNIDLTQNANYRTTFGLAANPTTVVVDGADPGENSDAIEAYLDTEVSGGIAPDASVIFYTAADTSYQSGLFLAIERALDDNKADILSVSFGQCESSLGASTNQFVQDIWEQAAAQGITVTVSTGDNGSAGCDDFDTETYANQGLAVSGFASTPYNIAVGGTDFDVLYSNFPTSFSSYVDLSNTLANHRSALKYIPEEPWNDSTLINTDIADNKPLAVNDETDSIVAGSGGISSLYPVPAWQASVATGNYRNLPDVSFLAGNGFYGAMWGLCTDLDTNSKGNSITDCASPTTGNNFNLTGVGGTSAAAPAFAGMLALLKQKTGARLGQANYVLYDLAKTKYSTVFHDVTTGDNSVNCEFGTSGCAKNTAGYSFMTGYDAGTGYDLASGWGSVDVSQLASNWASASFAATTTLLELNGSTSALSITHGQSVAVKATVSGSGGTPSGDIGLVDSLSPATNPNSEGITSFTLSSGSASGTTNILPGGSYNVTAHYGGDSTNAQSDSNAIPVTVAAESSTTNLTVEGYYDPATGYAATVPYYGFIYLIDAQPYGNSASATNPNGAASGTITFKSGSTTLGTAALSAEGVAELQTVSLTGGNNNLTAVFPGDSSFKANTSAPVSFGVTPAWTTLLLQSNVSDIWQGTAVTFTATLVSNSGSYLDSLGAAPTGTITFMDGTTTLGSSPVTGTAGTSSAYATGSATFTTSNLPIGTNYVTATYNGDTNYATSSYSPTATVTVLDPNSYPKISFSNTAITVAPGATTGNTSTVTVTPHGGFTGTVNLSCSISPAAPSDPATCSFSTNSVTLSGTSGVTSILTVTTTAASSAALHHTKLPGEPWYAAGGASLACLLLFGIPARRRNWRALLGMLALLVVLSGGLFACGGGNSGGGNSGTTPGTYTITVTGSSSTISVTQTTTLIVQ